MKTEQDKLPFSEKAIKAIDQKVESGKYLFDDSELRNLGIETSILEVEDATAGIIIPSYLNKIYYSSLCDIDLGTVKILPIMLDKDANRLGIKKYITCNLPTPIFNLIHEVRNLSRHVWGLRNECWAYRFDSELYRNDEEGARERANKLELKAKNIEKEHGEKLFALLELLSISSGITEEVADFVMQETAIQEE